MNVTQAMKERRSVRAYLPKAPAPALVQALLTDAAQAASGGNLQPWRVVALTGDALQQLTDAIVLAPPRDESVPNQSYPPNLWEPYRSRRFKNGEDMYKTISIPREDKATRLEQLAKNAQFFGAPVGILVFADERMGYAQWVDLGIYLQSLMATCAQGYWRRFGDTVERVLKAPEPYRVAYGVALGYEDTTAPINTLRADRAPFADWAQMRGFE